MFINYLTGVLPLLLYYSKPNVVQILIWGIPDFVYGTLMSIHMHYVILFYQISNVSLLNYLK